MIDKDCNSLYTCRVCNGLGGIDIGWTGPLVEECKNCDGTGCCDWIRNVIPLYYHADTDEWK